MDRLAEQGMRFERAYTPTGLCSPVRSSLLSGLYPHGHQVLTNVMLHPVKRSLQPDEDRLTPALKSAGYKLGYVGKWHVSDELGPLEFGFDDYVSLGDYFDWRSAQELPIEDQFFEYVTHVCARDPVEVSESRPAWLSSRATDLVDKYAAQENPFFIRLDFHGPHFPNVIPEPFYSMYKPEDIEPWPNAFDDLANKPAVHSIKKKHYGTDSYAWSDWQKLLAAYFGEISLIDDSIGQVLDHIETKGISENTLIIVTSDHGDTIGAHGICNKDYTMYEEIYNVPLIAKWPKYIAPSSVSDTYVMHFIDIFATLLDLVGDDPSDSHGVSMLPILQGDEKHDGRKDAFCEFHGSHMGLYSMRLLRTDRYAYVYQPNDIDELYDMQNDPWQMKNLAREPEKYGDVLSDLKRRMVEWMAETNDHIHNEWTVRWLTEDEALAREAPGRRNKSW